ncbi:MAG: hypothetical protein U0L11_11440 [Acutalibacteraceae bacterium]|nr:hypothetical protein [Acutalibacteraceae bacterium]
MTNKEKIELLKSKRPDSCSLEMHYQNLLELIGGLKRQYYDYMITEPINVDEELKRIETADFDLCGALLTLLLREDHFAQYGCFERRCKNGDVQRIIDRMIYVLVNRESEIRKRLQGRAAEYLMFMDD